MPEFLYISLGWSHHRTSHLIFKEHPDPPLFSELSSVPVQLVTVPPVKLVADIEFLVLEGCLPTEIPFSHVMNFICFLNVQQIADSRMLCLL